LNALGARVISLLADGELTPMEGRSGFKECPRCGLRNRISAVKCDFCGFEFQDSSEEWSDYIDILEKLSKKDEVRQVDEEVSRRIESTLVKPTDDVVEKRSVIDDQEPDPDLPSSSSVEEDSDVVDFVDSMFDDEEPTPPPESVEPMEPVSPSLEYMEDSDEEDSDAEGTVLGASSVSATDAMLSGDKETVDEHLEEVPISSDEEGAPEDQSSTEIEQEASVEPSPEMGSSEESVDEPPVEEPLEPSLAERTGEVDEVVDQPFEGIHDGDSIEKEDMDDSSLMDEIEPIAEQDALEQDAPAIEHIDMEEGVEAPVDVAPPVIVAHEEDTGPVEASSSSEVTEVEGVYSSLPFMAMMALGTIMYLVALGANLLLSVDLAISWSLVVVGSVLLLLGFRRFYDRLLPISEARKRRTGT
jgi:hypothetical protein